MECIFKIGTRVLLDHEEFTNQTVESNPVVGGPHECTGKIEKVGARDSWSTWVKWDNGQRNCYKWKHLRIASCKRCHHSPEYCICKGGK